MTLPRASPLTSRTWTPFEDTPASLFSDDCISKGRDFASVFGGPGIQKMEEMFSLLSRFDSMVEKCSTEIQCLNECYLDSGSSSSACSGAKQAYINCEIRMKADLAVVNKACGSQHAEYTSCMSSRVGNGVENCNPALQKFVSCAEVFDCTPVRFSQRMTHGRLFIPQRLTRLKTQM